MKIVKVLWHRWYFVVPLVLVCASLMVLAVLSSTSAKKQNSEKQLSKSEVKRTLHAQLRDGLGKEVKFDNSNENQIRESVNSTVDFILRRSGLRLSNTVKDRLLTLQTETAAGRRRRISSDDLINALTDTAMERLSSATDAEIDEAAGAFREGNGIDLRANGRGHTDKSTFTSQAKALREFAHQDNSTSREIIKAAVAGEVNTRLRDFSQALPAQFGDVATKGLMPAQAVLVTYSVVADDPLSHSIASLGGSVERLYHFWKTHGRQEPKPDKAYGQHGYIYSSPVNLLLDDNTSTRLLERLEERSKQ